jgi:hypothetical protein
MWGGNLSAIKKSTEILLDASKEFILEVMLAEARIHPCLVNKLQDNVIPQVHSRCFERAVNLRCVGTIIWSQNRIYEELKADYMRKCLLP